MFYGEKDSKNHFIFKKLHHFAQTAQKHTSYSRNEIILKIGHFAKAIAKQNGQ